MISPRLSCDLNGIRLLQTDFAVVSPFQIGLVFSSAAISLTTEHKAAASATRRFFMRNAPVGKCGYGNNR